MSPTLMVYKKHQNIILEDSEKALTVYMSEMTYIETWAMKSALSQWDDDDDNTRAQKTRTPTLNGCWIQ